MKPSKLYSRILPYVTGCPEPMVDQALLDAAAEFAERTQILFTIESPIPLVEGRASYVVFPDFGVGVDMIQAVYCGPRELRRATPSSLQDELPDWQTAKSSEPTHFSCFSDPGTIEVYPTPTNVQGATLRIQAAWAPGLHSEDIPDDMATRFYRDLVEGAKARLMAMPDRKWTNLPLAGVARGNFESGVVDARIKALHANAAGSITARPQRFGG